jgi:predicted DNA-binding protein
MIGLRLPKDEIARLDKWAKANGYTRSEAIRALIERGFEGWLRDNALNEATDGVMRQAHRIAELDYLVAELKVRNPYHAARVSFSPATTQKMTRPHPLKTTGHFTQLVWASSRALGMSMARRGNLNLLARNTAG